MKHIYTTFLFIAFLLVTPISCSKSNHTIIVGIDATRPPFVFKNAKHELTGFDIELMRSIAQHMGKDIYIRFVELPYVELLSAIQSGDIDLAISSIRATTSRRNRVGFSNEYTFDEYVGVYVKGTPYTSKAHINDAILGVQRGSSLESWVPLMQFSTIKPFFMDTRQGLVRALQQKLIDVLCTNKFVAQQLIRSHPDLGYFPLGYSQDGYAIAMKKNSPYQKQINSILSTMKKDETLETLIQTWLN